MTQQINLFDPVFRKPRQLLSATNIVLAVAVVAVGMAGYVYYAKQRLLQTEEAIDRANLEFKQVTEELARVGALPEPVPSNALMDEITRSEARLAARQALIDKLKGGGIGNTQGYSAYLAALARQHADGIWLTGVTVAEGGSEFVIHGRAMRAELLPGYLKLLNREEALRGRLISEMRILEREQEAPAAASTPRAVASPAAGDAGKQPEGAVGRLRIRFVDFTIGSGALPAVAR